MRTPVAVFKEDSSRVTFVGIAMSHAEASEIILGSRRNNSSIAKYLDGTINSMNGFIVVAADSRLVTANDIVELEEKALKRLKRAQIFRLNNDLISKLSDKDADTICKILSKYKQ